MSAGIYNTRSKRLSLVLDRAYLTYKYEDGTNTNNAKEPNLYKCGKSFNLSILLTQKTTVVRMRERKVALKNKSLTCFLAEKAHFTTQTIAMKKEAIKMYFSIKVQATA